jgi:DNA-binding response OmpR family regulator
MNILLLEDEVMLHEAVAEYLERIGHVVTSFFDGQSALESILKQEFDILVLDINVPDLDGFELLQALHDHQIYTPAIYTSALIDIEDISRGFDLGAYDYLKKPFHLQELSIRIDRIKAMVQTPSTHIV